MRRTTKSLVRVISLLAAVVVVSVFVITWQRGEPFDRDRWRAAAGDDEVRRIKMAEDLLRRDDLIGQNRSQIIWLLGQPTDSNKFQGLCDDLYHLGPQRGLFPIDSEWLCFKYEANQVTRAEVIAD